MKCHFCKRTIKWTELAHHYLHRYYHEKCWRKVESVAKATGGVL